MKEKLIDACRTLGWTAIGCISIYIIIAFVFVVIFTVLGFIGGLLFAGSSSTSPDTTTRTSQ